MLSGQGTGIRLGEMREDGVWRSASCKSIAERANRSYQSVSLRHLCLIMMFLRVSTKLVFFLLSVLRYTANKYTFVGTMHREIESKWSQTLTIWPDRGKRTTDYHHIISYHLPDNHVLARQMRTCDGLTFNICLGNHIIESTGPKP